MCDYQIAHSYLPPLQSEFWWDGKYAHFLDMLWHTCKLHCLKPKECEKPIACLQVKHYENSVFYDIPKRNKRKWYYLGICIENIQRYPCSSNFAQNMQVFKIAELITKLFWWGIL